MCVISEPGRQQFIELEGASVLRRFCFNYAMERCEKKWDRLVARSMVVFSRTCPSHQLPIESQISPLRFQLPKGHDNLPDGTIPLHFKPHLQFTKSQSTGFFFDILKKKLKPKKLKFEKNSSPIFEKNSTNRRIFEIFQKKTQPTGGLFTFWY